MATSRRSRRRNTEQHRVQIQYTEIDDLAPYEYNPRDNTQAVRSVANSIQSFGFLVPVVVDGDNVIIAGHTRVEAAKTLSMDAVPTIKVTHLTDDQVKQFRLIDNKVAELARWDFDLLSGEISSLQQSGIDFTEFGWSQEEIDCLSDVVSGDCLGAGDVADLDAEERRRRAERRAPNRTRMVVGEIVFFIPSQVYRQWVDEVRSASNFDEAAVIHMLKDRLGILPFMEGYEE